jgi:group I intron endonuclease
MIKGKIYQILNNIDNEVYIGSTTQPLARRWTDHKKVVGKGTTKLYKHMEKHGKESFYIELIKNFDCETKEQLRAEEGKYIRELGTLNQIISGRTMKEYYEENKQKYIERSKKNGPAYREKNREYLKVKAKERYMKNIEHVKARQKKQIMCICGSTYQSAGKSAHLKSKKHQSFIAENKQL